MLQTKYKIDRFFSTFRTHELEVLSPNFEKAPLRIDNIAGKFEDATDVTEICSGQNKKWQNWKFFQHFEPMTLKY